LREAIIAERARRKGPDAASPSATQRELPTTKSRENQRTAAATCAICGLGGTEARPLVHARCMTDEVPF